MPANTKCGMPFCLIASCRRDVCARINMRFPHHHQVMVKDAAKCKACSDILLDDHGIYAQVLDYSLFRCY